MEKTDQRLCGACTACCTVLRVDEIEKPFFTNCQYSKAGTGCSIYNERPPSCRKYRCLWLRGDFEEKERPDRIGVLFDHAINKESPPGGILQIWELTPRALNQELVQKITEEYLGRSVYVSHIPRKNRRKKLFIPASQWIGKEVKLTEGLNFKIIFSK